MASSRVMTSTSSTSSDSARRRSESMDGLIRDLCVGKMNVVESERSEIIGDRRVPISVERVQKDEFEAITLEDFLAVSENNYQQPMEREKRKTVVDFVDEAELQKQKRMIKNRKSAARSWERKQAYIQQLEALLAKLEEENAALLEEQAERRKARFKHLMKNLVPVEEREKLPPSPRLRRTCSGQL